jgi:predicted AAA+ superfamily ATPase
MLATKICLKDRLTGLVEPHNTSNSTLLLKIIKNKLPDNRNVIYFSINHVRFNKTTLYEFIEELYLAYGINTFFIDDIHQYKNWGREIKNVYDGFPEIKIVFSYKSDESLDKQHRDLSWRARIFYLN